MTYQIDQSGKIEYTKKLTVVAFSNSKVKSLQISVKEKRKLIQVMRALDRPQKSFVYKIFAGMVFLLIKNEKAGEVIIDREYYGNEGIIKNIIIQLFQKHNIKSPEISFALVSKGSNAHKIAIEVFRGKREPDMIVEAREILNLFYSK